MRPAVKTPAVLAPAALGLLAPAALALLVVVASAAPLTGVEVDGSMPVAFEGSALLFPYYSGAAQGLLERGVILPKVTPLSGLSGGAITSTLTHLGLNGSAQAAFWQDLVLECTEMWGDCAGHFNAIFEEKLDELLPADAASQVNGVLRIAVSQLNGNKMDLNRSASWVVSNFMNKDDLKSILTSTDYIPCLTGSTTYSIFRNQPVIDGGYANGFKQLCKDTANCLKVASWYVGEEADHTCDPAVCGSYASLDNCRAAERTEPIPTTLYKNGRFVDQWDLTNVEQRCPEAVYSNANVAPYPLPDFVPHNQTMPDIYPGKYGPLPTFNGKEILACQWQIWAMKLPVGQEVEAMGLFYEQGLADALSWCDANGY